MCYPPLSRQSLRNRWGPVTLSDETKLTKPLRTPLIATAKRGDVTSGLVLILPRLRDGCSMTQGMVCTGSFFVSICLLITPSQTYVHKELAPARIKQDLKAVGKLVDLLENVFTPILLNLHWLPIHYLIVFKILLITYKALNNLAPLYIRELLTPYVPARQLRSSSKIYL